MAVFEIHPMRTEDDTTLARELLREYHAGMREDRCFVGFEREIRDLPGDYAPPQGELLLATVHAEGAGCVALRPMKSPGCAEFKRFYVRPEFRGLGIGIALMEEIMSLAQSKGFKEVRLDTIPTLDRAIAMYRRYGFAEVEPWAHPPSCGVLYMAYRFAD